MDIQNAFASKGGMLDLAGIDVRPVGDAVAKARLRADAARAAGIPVIYLVMGYPRTNRRRAAMIHPIPTRNSRCA